MKRFGSVLMVMLLLVLWGVTASGQEVKIGYVDRIKVFSQLDRWKNADIELGQLQEQAQLELQSILIEADSLNNTLETQMMLTEAARNQIQERIATLSRDYQRLQLQRQQELVNRESELKSPIINDFEGIVEKIGISEGFVLIYDKAANSIVFAAGGRDLTEQVLFELKRLDN